MDNKDNISKKVEKNAKKIAELEAEKKKLDDEISSLKQEYNKTKKEWIKYKQEELKKYVGRCYVLRLYDDDWDGDLTANNKIV